MSYSELEELLKDKNIEQVLTPIHIGDSVRLGIKKPPADFQKGIIGRMKATIPGNNLNSRNFRIPREY